MKAIRVDQFGAPEVMRYVETIDPEVGPGQVRVRLQAIGVNPVDTYWRAGMNPALKLPYTPGLDGAGVVDQVGAGVTTCRVGDRVYLGTALPCTYAELAAVPAARVFALPASCSFEAGAALHVPYATAHRALFHRGQGRAGETVFIHGASGAVGLAATQFARAHGFRVIGSAGSEAGRRLALEQGLHHVVDH
ncbi:MAG: NADPH:quinone reductase, partial [Verrucomicrobia bacterium]|nr:NADPH:quinone reductase [Verrucomicrobiota bacterium]